MPLHLAAVKMNPRTLAYLSYKLTQIAKIGKHFIVIAPIRRLSTIQAHGEKTALAKVF